MTSGLTSSASRPSRSGLTSAPIASASSTSGGSARRRPHRREPIASWPRPGHSAESRAATCRLRSEWSVDGRNLARGMGLGFSQQRGNGSAAPPLATTVNRCRDAPGGIVVGCAQPLTRPVVQVTVTISARAHDAARGPGPVRRGVRALRHRRGWRQQDLADAAVVSRSVIVRIETGQAGNVPLGEGRPRSPARSALDPTCASTGTAKPSIDCIDADHARLVEVVAARFFVALAGRLRQRSHSGSAASADRSTSSPGMRRRGSCWSSRSSRWSRTTSRCSLRTTGRSDWVSRSPKSRGWNGAAVAKLLVIARVPDGSPSRRGACDDLRHASTRTARSRSVAGWSAQTPSRAVARPAGFCQMAARRALVIGVPCG